MREHRLGLLVALAVMLWSGHAYAGFSITMNPIDCGNDLAGDTTGVTCMSADLSNNNGGMYDIALSGSCDPNEWSISPTSVNLSSSKTMTATFTAQMSGSRSCTVRVYDKNTTNEVFSFGLRGNGQTRANISVNFANPDFGSVRYSVPGAASTRNIVVSNTGDQTLDISDVVINPTNAGFSIQSGGTGGSIVKGTPKTWVIAFDPAGSAGSRSATITFSSNDGSGDSPSFNMMGISTTATIDVTPSPPTEITYGTVNEGNQRTMDVTVANSVSGATSGPLGVSRAVISGGSWFTFTNCSTPSNRDCTVPFSVANGSPALVGVKCSPPTGAGTSDQTATVTFTSDSDSGSDNVVNLRCTPGVILVSAEMVSVDFGSKLVLPGGGTAVNVPMMVTNAGTVDADLTFALSSGDPSQFDVTCLSNPCRAVKKDMNNVPGTAMIQVTFKPDAEGDLFTNLDVNLNGGNRNGPSISLVGHGIDKHLGVLGDLEFPDTFRHPGDKATEMVVPITNTGEYDLQVQDITVNDGTIWSLSEAFSSFTVAPGDTVDVKVKFQPEEEGKAPMGMVTVTTNDIRPETGTQTINLIGNGKLRNVDLAPGSIDVGDTFAGIPARLSITRPGDILTVLNMDQETFNIRDIKISGEDEDVFHLINLDGSEFSSVDIAPGGSQTFDIVFDPSVPGEFTSSVVLYLDQDNDVQKSIPITGRAVYVSAHGAGGCSVGGGSSGGLVVVCVAGVLVVRRRRR